MHNIMFINEFYLLKYIINNIIKGIMYNIMFNNTN